MHGSQFHAPPLSRVNKMLIMAMVAGFLLNTIATTALKFPLFAYLGLSLTGLSKGLLFQFITYPFVEQSFMGVIFEGLLIWFIGSELEQKWGQKFYIKFLTLSALSVALLFVFLSFFIAASSPLFGMTGVGYALLVAYALIYSERQLLFMFIFPLKAKYFCLLLAGIQLYMGVFSSQGALSLTHLMAMVFAFAYLKFKSLRARGVSMESIRKKHHKERMKSKLTLIKPEEEKDQQKADPSNPRFWQ